MRYRVRISDRAKVQLFEAAEWWANHRSLSEAADWLVGFESLIEGLGVDPDRHPLAPEAARYGTELRQIHYGLSRKKTHRAIFEVRANEVLIHAIRHLAQDDVDVLGN